MTTTREGQRNLESALTGLSYRQTWSLCVEALRDLRRAGPKVTFKVSTLQGYLFPLLKRHLGLADNIELAPLYDALQHDHGAHVLQFLIWLERAGLAYPLGSNVGSYVDTMRMLPAGMKFLDGELGASPYHPEWIARIKKDCPGVTDEIVSLLEDAVSCFQHGLNRPAVGLLGVAFEAAIIEVFDRLSTTHNITMKPPKAQKAWQYIEAVRSGIDARITTAHSDYKDRRASARRACDFADDLRERRNQASHPLGASFDDPSEVDEMFISAARKLPQLWQLY